MRAIAEGRDVYHDALCWWVAILTDDDIEMRFETRGGILKSIAGPP